MILPGSATLLLLAESHLRPSILTNHPGCFKKTMHALGRSGRSSLRPAAWGAGTACLKAGSAAEEFLGKHAVTPGVATARKHPRGRPRSGLVIPSREHRCSPAGAGAGLRDYAESAPTFKLYSSYHPSERPEHSSVCCLPCPVCMEATYVCSSMPCVPDWWGAVGTSTCIQIQMARLSVCQSSRTLAKPSDLRPDKGCKTFLSLLVQQHHFVQR